MRHKLAVAFAAAIAILIALVAAAPAASATPVLDPPKLGVFVLPLEDGTGFRICPMGEADPGLGILARWEFHIVGVRASLAEPVFNYAYEPDGYDFDMPCLNMFKLAPSGTFTATLAVITDRPDAETVTGRASWSPFTPDEVSSMTAGDCENGC